MFKRWSEYDNKANTQEGMKAACRRRFYTFISWLTLIKTNIKLDGDYEVVMNKENKNYKPLVKKIKSEGMASH
jgi:hypothetical protein